MFRGKMQICVGVRILAFGETQGLGSQFFGAIAARYQPFADILYG
jgi:hypothetical protein